MKILVRIKKCAIIICPLWVQINGIVFSFSFLTFEEQKMKLNMAHPICFINHIYQTNVCFAKLLCALHIEINFVTFKIILNIFLV